MRAALAWYVVVQIAGLATFRLTSGCFQSLPDLGYGVSKALGVLALGLLLWIGAALGLLRNDAGGALLTAAALVTAAAAAGSPRWPGWRVVLAAETLFLVVFAGWCVVRALTPDVNHTEQPMDLMMLTAMSVSPTVPPPDPWLAGYPIGYYYLGYWLMNAVALIAHTPPEVAYNVAQACWLALLATGCLSLGLNLAATGDEGGWRRKVPLGAGALAVVTVVATANLHSLVEWLRAAAGGASSALTLGSYWSSSRAMTDRSLAGRSIELITEFPFFSYLLGDNHPHLLAMPFVVAALVCGLSLLGDERPGRTQLLLAVALAGALIGLNTWDVPAVLVALGAVVWGPALAMRRRAEAWRRLRLAAPALALVAVAVVPYLITAQSQVRGVLPNLFHPTPAGSFLTMFGSLLPGVALLVAVAWRQDRAVAVRLPGRIAAVLMMCAIGLALSATWAAGTASGRSWLAVAGDGIDHPLASAARRWATGWPVLVVAVAGAVTAASLVEARWQSGMARPAGPTFALILAAIGLLLTATPELVYVHDVFSSRVNTVFKAYYQAWLYLGAAASAGIVLGWRHGGGLRAGAVLATALLGTTLVYPVKATQLVLAGARTEMPTLDGLAYLDRRAPDARAAVSWVRANTPPTARIAQAPGDSYQPADSLLSTATGRPALLGWSGHERQWRGAAFESMSAGRLDALARIYRPRSIAALRATLGQWDVALVYLGPAERARYAITPEHEAHLAAVLSLVFDQGGVRLYRRRG